MVGQGLGSYGPNGIQKDGTVSEHWRLQLGYPPFRVDRDRLNGHIFGSIARREASDSESNDTLLQTTFYGQSNGANPLSVEAVRNARINVKFQL